MARGVPVLGYHDAPAAARCYRLASSKRPPSGGWGGAAAERGRHVTRSVCTIARHRLRHLRRPHVTSGYRQTLMPHMDALPQWLRVARTAHGVHWRQHMQLP
jgi:hypothetical protein